MRINVIVICTAILLSLGLASGLNNAVDRAELTNMGYSYNSLVNGLGFWSLGNFNAGNTIFLIFLDYGSGSQFNHWVSISRTVSQNHLIDIANWNMLDMRSNPELYYDDYTYHDLIDTVGSWDNGGSKTYGFYGPNDSLNGWRNKAQEENSNFYGSTESSCVRCQKCYDDCIKYKEEANQKIDRYIKLGISIVPLIEAQMRRCDQYLCL
jgi:NAD-dependent dihydropyrimidine dehydrogenase PreA subunit